LGRFLLKSERNIAAAKKCEQRQDFAYIAFYQPLKPSINLKRSSVLSAAGNQFLQ
jgi:hypothetical protein